MDSYNFSFNSVAKFAECYDSIWFDETSENDKCEIFVKIYALMKSTPKFIRTHREPLLKTAARFQGQERPEKIRRIADKILRKTNEVQKEACVLSIPGSGCAAFIDAGYSSDDYFLLTSGSMDGVSQSPLVVRHVDKLKKKLSENDPQLFAELESHQYALKMQSKERNNINNSMLSIDPTLIETDVSRASELIGMKREKILQLYREKILSLKVRMQNSFKKTKRIVILGAGPAGLCRALVAIIKGYTVTILEKRGDPRTRSDGRSNVLHLGHGYPWDDIGFLLQYGVFESLILSKAIKKSPYGGFEVSIEDLEKHMALLVEEFQPGALISSTGDVKIVPSRDSEATVSFHGKSMFADLVILAEGAKSAITKSLGVTFRTLSKKSLVPVGFFEPDNSFGADLLHAISSLYSLGKELLPMIINQDLEEIKNKLYSKGILFRNEKRDYVGIPLSEDEEAEIKALSLEAQKAYVKERLIQRHKEIDIALSALLPEAGVPRAAILKEHKIIPIQIKKAETPLFTAGKTLFLVRGDAHGTTNPASGYGAKTALCSYSSDSELLNLFEWSGINRFITTPFINLANKSLEDSQRIGVKKTGEYRTLFEKIDFYLDLEKESSSFPQLDLSEIVYFLTKIKYSSLTDQEKKRVEAIREELVLYFQSRHIENSCLSGFSSYLPKAFQNYLADSKIPGDEINALVSAIDPYHDRSRSFEVDFRINAMRNYSHPLNRELPFVIFMGILGFMDKILFHKPDLN